MQIVFMSHYGCIFYGLINFFRVPVNFTTETKRQTIVLNVLFILLDVFCVLLNNFTVTGSFQSNKNIFLWFFVCTSNIKLYNKKLWDESRCYTQGETFFRSPLQKRPLYNQIKAGCCYFKIVLWIVRNSTRASTAKIGFKCQ